MKFKCISKKILPDIPMYTTISKTLFDWEKSEDIWRTCKIDNVNEWSREIKTEEDEQMNDDGWGYEEKQTICYFEEEDSLCFKTTWKYIKPIINYLLKFKKNKIIFKSAISNCIY